MGQYLDLMKKTFQKTKVRFLLLKKNVKKTEVRLFTPKKMAKWTEKRFGHKFSFLVL